MRKVLLTTAVTLATTLFLSTGHTAPGKKGHGHSHGMTQTEKHKHKNKKRNAGKGRSALISYEIDPDSCAVTINSTKDLSNIVIKNDSGRIVEKWDNLNGTSFSDFGMYTTVLTDGELYVKSGNNGKRGKRNRGLGAEIGDMFRAELTVCFEEPLMAECPIELKNEVNRVKATVSEVGVVDDGNRCVLYGSTGNAIGFYNGLSGDNGNQVGASFIGPDGTNTLVPLSLEEADACQLHTSLCRNFVTRLP